jgi:SAM-dependent methyltransferase
VRADEEPHTGRGLAAVLDTIRRAQVGDLPADSVDVTRALEELVAETASVYTQKSSLYAERRGDGPSEFDESMTAMLLATVRAGIDDGSLAAPSGRRWRLLDVGAGPGRDVHRFLQEPDVCPVAVENAPGFVEILRERVARLGMPDTCVVAADMRDLSPLADETFVCVRNHATLHHLPVIALGVGADAAVAEARRVLVPGGVFHVLVKAGVGIELIDTEEGMGPRFFQLFTAELLGELLTRHRFEIMHMEERVSDRPAGAIPWWFCLSRAV